MPSRENQPLTIRRYARSRLYDAANLRYVTIEQLRGWASEGHPVVVVDAETGTDVTRVLLA